MNQVCLIGRLTKDPELKEYGKGKDAGCLVRFTLAVDRSSKDDAADFISCIAFGKTAELIDTYLGKGSKIGISGSIQTGSYEREDGKRYTTDVIVTRLDFCDSKKKSEEEEEEEEKPKKKYRK